MSKLPCDGAVNVIQLTSKENIMFCGRQDGVIVSFTVPAAPRRSSFIPLLDMPLRTFTTESIPE